MARSILFVDDNPLDLELASLAFEEFAADGELGTESDPERAIERLRRGLVGEGRAPDAVLIDVRMPKMDGFQLAARIREELPGCRARLVLFTTSKNPETVRRASAVGLEIEVKPAELAGYVDLFGRLSVGSGTSGLREHPRRSERALPDQEVGSSRSTEPPEKSRA